MLKLCDVYIGLCYTILFFYMLEKFQSKEVLSLMDGSHIIYAENMILLIYSSKTGEMKYIA